MRIHTVQDLGRAIKASRKWHSLTQELAAGLCGVSMPFMNQLEGGKREHLSISKILGVCARLGLGVHVLTPQEAKTVRLGREALAAATAGVEPKSKAPDA